MKENNSYDKEIALNGSLNDKLDMFFVLFKNIPLIIGVLSMPVKDCIIWVYTWRVWPLSRQDFSRAIPAMTHRPI